MYSDFLNQSTPDLEKVANERVSIGNATWNKDLNNAITVFREGNTSKNSVRIIHLVKCEVDLLEFTSLPYWPFF